MAMVQSQWYHFGIGAPPILVYFSGDWDVHWGYGVDPWPYGSAQPTERFPGVGQFMQTPSECSKMDFPEEKRHADAEVASVSGMVQEAGAELFLEGSKSSFSLSPLK